MNRGFERGASILLVMLGFVACAGHDDLASYAQGGERQPCYGNGTCNAGLWCLSNLCVLVPNDAGSDIGVGAVPDEAGESSAIGMVIPVTGESPDGAFTPADGGSGPYRELAPNQLGISAYWLTVNDCMSNPRNCTTGGNEPTRDFDKTPFCTTGVTALYDGINWGSSLLLGIDGTFDARAAGVVGMTFDLQGTAPPALDVEVQSDVPAPQLAVGEAGPRPMGQRSTVFFDAMTTPPYAVPFDPSKLDFASFDILAERNRTIAFDYCIANFAFLARR